MADKQIIQKLLAKKTNINSNKFRAKTLEIKDLEEIGKQATKLAELPINLYSNVRTIQHIEALARKLKNKKNLGLLIIDYIQLIKNKGKFNSREQEVADISRTLKLLSLELDIPIIALCQLNRTANRAEPTLAELRESGSLEQDADNVIFLYQENENEEQVVEVIVKIAKQRAGETGKTKLRFDKKIGEFREILYGI